jgi:cardiolipin synthase (CMP-forming)
MRITANQVTLLRLLLMPLLVTCLYFGPSTRPWILVVGTLVGLTDMLDGWLARRQGPTVLGGLMDPIADKVFLAICCLPFVDLGWAPAWAALALLSRELVITALRSSLEMRHQSLRTIYLAKVKTWVQMLALGFVLAIQLGPRPETVSLFLLGLGIAAAAGVLLWGAVRRTLWRGGIIFAFSFGASWAGWELLGPTRFLFVVFAGAVAITWISGLSYVAVGFRILVSGLTRFDAVRLLGALVLPVIAVLVLTQPSSSIVVVSVTALVCLELANGGLDNLLAHHDAADSAWSWGSRVLGASAFLTAAYFLPYRELWAASALAVCFAGTIVAFWRNRRFYLEEKLREKKARVTAPAAG